MKIQCPAKINLFLEVTGRRRDGYHALATLFAKINLYDVLEFSKVPGKGPVLEIESESGPPPLSAGEDNLVLRAAREFYAAFGIGIGVGIRLVKNIPIGAGLGGGSSDAAGALLGLARFFKMKVSGEVREKLLKIGRGLGADVPLFLRPEPFCLGRGVGEKLSPAPVRESLPYLVLVYPNFPVSTAEAYKALPEPSRPDVLTRLKQLDKLLACLDGGRPPEEWAPLLFNRLEEARVPALARVERVRRILERLGMLGVRMSGSGSSIFGFVSSYEEGKRLSRRLAAYPWRVFLTSCQG